MTLFDQILEMQELVDAIASNREYKQLQEGNHLAHLNIQLADIEIFLWRLNELLMTTTEVKEIHAKR